VSLDPELKTTWCHVISAIFFLISVQARAAAPRFSCQEGNESKVVVGISQIRCYMSQQYIFVNYVCHHVVVAVMIVLASDHNDELVTKLYTIGHANTSVRMSMMDFLSVSPEQPL
jgi:hypothetical protein